MLSSLIIFIRRLDPASDYSLSFAPVTDEFSWGQILDDRLQGPQNGSWLVTASDGLAVIGEFGRKALAAEHLAWSKAQSRTLRRWISYNGWRLRFWAEDQARWWRRRLAERHEVRF